MNDLAQPGRRGFLMTTGAATALASTASLAAVSAPVCQPGLTGPEHTCVRELAVADFAPLLGQRFTVYAPGHAAVVTLTRARAVTAAGVNRPYQARTMPFSLEFHAAAGTRLEAGIHEFSHDKLGMLKLSLNPVGPAVPGTPAVYEVVFG